MLDHEKAVVDSSGLKIVSFDEFLNMELPPLENILDPWL